MKFIAIFLFLVLAAGLGGFAWLALSDVPLQQKEVVKEIEYDSLQDTP
jgi:hypothetical protein